MDNIRLAQFLVSIADELDDNGFEKEANDVDNIIKGLVVEAQENPNITARGEDYGIDYSQRKREYDEYNLPIPFEDETYQEWYSQLNELQKDLVNLKHRRERNPGSWWKTNKGEAADLYRQLDQSRLYADQTKYPGYEFLGRDKVTGGPWYKSKDGKYWYQDPQTEQWKEFSQGQFNQF